MKYAQSSVQFLTPAEVPPNDFLGLRLSVVNPATFIKATAQFSRALSISVKWCIVEFEIFNAVLLK